MKAAIVCIIVPPPPPAFSLSPGRKGLIVQASEHPLILVVFLKLHIAFHTSAQSPDRQDAEPGVFERLSIQDIGDFGGRQLRGKVFELIWRDDTIDYFKTVCVICAERQWRSDVAQLEVGVRGKLVVKAIEFAVLAVVKVLLADGHESPFSLPPFEFISFCAEGLYIDFFYDDTP